MRRSWPPGSSPLARGLLIRDSDATALDRIIPARAGFTACTGPPRRWSRDHPRSRGVYKQLSVASRWNPGSSPLARGLLAWFQAYVQPTRIIPARAGFTPGGHWSSFLAWDHPRSRGVYSTPHSTFFGTKGSSPLARGLPLPRLGAGDDAEIIPARAGFTRVTRAIGWSRPDHPRSRGVYAESQCDDAFLLGSSPLARGLQFATNTDVTQRRIIPARAGFTVRDEHRRDSAQDHPRSRGVYLSEGAEDEYRAGSSPLARGLRASTRSRSGGRGIIPARAGFTARRRARGAPPPDHPRSRGVYKTRAHGHTYLIGSSPLARGLRGVGVLPGLFRRIIPARAGFTGADPLERDPDRDHPRSRGVYLVTRTIPAGDAGSSPLARGLPCPGRPGVLPDRIIPARAGFTE